MSTAIEFNGCIPIEFTICHSCHKQWLPPRERVLLQLFGYFCNFLGTFATLSRFDPHSLQPPFTCFIVFAMFLTSVQNQNGLEHLKEQHLIPELPVVVKATYSFAKPNFSIFLKNFRYPLRKLRGQVSVTNASFRRLSSKLFC